MIRVSWWRSTNDLLYVFLLLVGSASYAQEPLEQLRKQYEGFNEVVLDDSQVYDISIENRKLKILLDNRYESMILSETGIGNNEESFSYSDLVKLKRYEAWSVIPNNGKEKKIKVTQVTEKGARQSSVFYDDVRERRLVFPNLEAGARKVYEYQTEFTDPHLLHKFVFGGGLPVRQSTLEIRAEKDIEIGYKVFNDPDNRIEFTTTEKKGSKIYRWTLRDVKPMKYEANTPGFLYVMPHINVFVKEYKVDNKRIDVLNDTNRLFAYYQGFVKDLNKTEVPALKTLSLDITKDCTSDEEKVKAIFYWVKDNIKYIAFENGYEGFIPREAGTVFERRFGDCKDMASIITSMSHYAGVPDVSIAWIGTRSIPYTYSELATPAVDDHMIAAYRKDGTYLFLDATDKDTRYGIPTAFIQGKEALVNKGDSYEIVTVPVVSPAQNRISETVTLTLDKDKLAGSGKVSYEGYSRSHLLAQIGDASKKTRFDMIKGLVLKGNNKFQLKEFKEENLTDREKPYIIDYTFDLDNYVVKADNDIYVNLCLDKYYERSDIEKDRVSPYEFDFLTATQSRYELTLPAGYTVQYVPKDLQLDNDLLVASLKYETMAGKVTLDLNLQQKKMLFTKDDFSKWNDIVKTLRKNYTESIILTQKK
ncbi:MAG TPA: DUF3857 domain-containing protein [Flavobacterium sp.]|nr:DUF3857 domain-containing protein [Flavobacterium sp.]